MVVDDHPIMRKALSDVLEESGRFVVVGQAGGAKNALNKGRLSGLDADWSGAIASMRRVDEWNDG